MKTKINGVNHKIVYIEYQDNIPFAIVTIRYVKKAVNGAYWRHVQWDVFAESGNKNDLRLYESGCGGSSNKIYAPKYIENSTASYWMDESFSFEGEPKNITKLNEPLLIKTDYGRNSNNPFTNGEITFSNEYCEKCEHHSTDFCYKHKYTDDNGNDRWHSDNKIVIV